MTIVDGIFIRMDKETVVKYPCKRTEEEIVQYLDDCYAERDYYWDTEPTNFALNVLQGEIRALKWILGEAVNARIVDIAQH